MSQKSYNGQPCLYLVPTPIGNLEDITIRALNILKEVDYIFSEDTRVTKILLQKYDISNNLIANHEHNEDLNKEKMLDYLNNGKNLAIVTDRGTPAISDPGYHLAKCAIDNKFNVVALPGPTALIPALIMSGLDAQPFLFYGFLNSKEAKRKKELLSLKSQKYTVIFYEAPHRISKTLDNIEEIFGNRMISISREISKRFEEVYRGLVSEVKEEIIGAKGEMVLIVSGLTGENNIDFSNISLTDHVNYYISQGYSSKESLKKVADDKNCKKSEVYSKFHVNRSKK